MLEEAFATADAMEQQGFRPEARTMNLLINACTRTKQPHRARALVEEMRTKHGETSLLQALQHWAFSQGACCDGVRQCADGRVQGQLTARAGVQPDRWTYNALLGCCSRAGDMDGAHEVWTQMKHSDVPPDAFTVVWEHRSKAVVCKLSILCLDLYGLVCSAVLMESAVLCVQRALSEAFGSNVALAAEVTREAHQLQVSSPGLPARNPTVSRIRPAKCIAHEGTSSPLH